MSDGVLLILQACYLLHGRHRLRVQMLSRTGIRKFFMEICVSMCLFFVLFLHLLRFVAEIFISDAVGRTSIYGVRYCFVLLFVVQPDMTRYLTCIKLVTSFIFSSNIFGLHPIPSARKTTDTALFSYLTLTKCFTHGSQQHNNEKWYRWWRRWWWWRSVRISVTMSKCARAHSDKICVWHCDCVARSYHRF